MKNLVAGPYGQHKEQFFCVFDNIGAEVARVFVISHGVDVKDETARAIAQGRALYLAENVSKEPTP